MNLDAEVSTINIVAQEEIASVRRMTANLKQFHQVVKLPVHISAHCRPTQHPIITTTSPLPVQEKDRFAQTKVCCKTAHTVLQCTEQARVVKPN